jgi:hypothetical protein
MSYPHYNPYPPPFGYYMPYYPPPGTPLAGVPHAPHGNPIIAPTGPMAPSGAPITSDHQHDQDPLGKWHVTKDAGDPTALLLHQTSCFDCANFRSHIITHTRSHPLPDNVIYQLITQILTRHHEHYLRMIPSFKNPNKSNPNHTSAKSIFERVGIVPDPSSTTQPSPPKSSSSFNSSEVSSPFMDSRKDTIPPSMWEGVVEYENSQNNQDGDNHTTLSNNIHHWIPNHSIFEFLIPAPLLFNQFSIFRSIGQFFNITPEQFHSLSVTDLRRFKCASRNTHPMLRTQLMQSAATDYEEHVWKRKSFKVQPPYGLPERWWSLMEQWMMNPTGIPFTVHEDESGLLSWQSTTTHLWVSEVTKCSNYYLVNLLLILFSDRARALLHIWKDIIPQSAKPDCNSTTHPLPWQFRVPANTVFACKYDHITIMDLTAYTLWLSEVAYFPIDDIGAVDVLCDWADEYIRGTSCNPYSRAPKEHRQRLQIVDAAHLGQPWFAPDEN